MPTDEVEESASRWAQPQPTARSQPGGEPYPAVGDLHLTAAEAETEPVSAEEIGHRSPTACAAAGITYSQLDCWARTGLVEPSVRADSGSGTQRLYSFRDILVLKVVKRLLDTGISKQQIRAAVQHLRDSEARLLRTISDSAASLQHCMKGALSPTSVYGQVPDDAMPL
jgi:DNA-binding transcriptional MerR regulator